MFAFVGLFVILFLGRRRGMWWGFRMCVYFVFKTSVVCVFVCVRLYARARFFVRLFIGFEYVGRGGCRFSFCLFGGL